MGRHKSYTIYPPARAYEPPAPPPKPLEYQLVDLLGDELPEEVSEAIRLLLPFIGKCRRLDAVAAEEGELAAMQHDLERVMARENLYLNALMEITGLKDREAVKIAARALYGQQFKLPPEDDAGSDLERLRSSAESADRGEGISLRGLPSEERRALLASGTLTEGGDVEQAPGESLSGPVPQADAQTLSEASE